jgi:small redox-active disulfide protein 2
MHIQVLGSGCPSCKQLYESTKQAVAELKLEADVEYITDVTKIVEMGVMESPVLAVDGNPVVIGMVPEPSAIKDLLSQADETACCGTGGCGGGCCCGKD